MPDPVQVRSMFGRIARRYDLLNSLLSVGIDQRWRAAAVRSAGELASGRVLDACTGTGDLALAFAARGARVLAVDFTPQMVSLARRKGAGWGGRVHVVQGDALCLPSVSAGVDLASVAFGIRNVADRTRALQELMRVVRPGGRVLVLEFSMPPGRILGGLYRLYFTRLLPLVGRLVSRDKDAYDYLPRTVMAWPSPEAFCRELDAVGLVDTGLRRLTFGIACLHWGTVPDSGV